MGPTGLSMRSLGHIPVTDPVLRRVLASPPTHGLLSPTHGSTVALGRQAAVPRLRACELEGTEPCEVSPASLPVACNRLARPCKALRLMIMEGRGQPQLPGGCHCGCRNDIIEIR